MCMVTANAIMAAKQGRLSFNLVDGRRSNTKTFNLLKQKVKEVKGDNRFYIGKTNVDTKKRSTRFDKRNLKTWNCRGSYRFDKRNPKTWNCRGSYRFDKRNPKTWDLKGIQSRKNDHIKNKSFSHVVVIGIITKSNKPKRYHNSLERYALSLEQALIHRFSYDRNLTNRTSGTGRECKKKHRGYLIYVAIGNKEQPACVDRPPHMEGKYSVLEYGDGTEVEVARKGNQEGTSDKMGENTSRPEHVVELNNNRKRLLPNSQYEECSLDQKRIHLEADISLGTLPILNRSKLVRNIDGNEIPENILPKDEQLHDQCRKPSLQVPSTKCSQQKLKQRGSKRKKSVSNGILQEVNKRSPKIWINTSNGDFNHRTSHTISPHRKDVTQLRYKTNKKEIKANKYLHYASRRYVSEHYAKMSEGQRSPISCSTRTTSQLNTATRHKKLKRRRREKLLGKTASVKEKNAKRTTKIHLKPCHVQPNITLSKLISSMIIPLPVSHLVNLKKESLYEDISDTEFVDLEQVDQQHNYTFASHRVDFEKESLYEDISDTDLEQELTQSENVIQKWKTNSKTVKPTNDMIYDAGCEVFDEIHVAIRERDTEQGINTGPRETDLNKLSDGRVILPYVYIDGVTDDVYM